MYLSMWILYRKLPKSKIPPVIGSDNQPISSVRLFESGISLCDDIAYIGLQHEFTGVGEKLVCYNSGNMIFFDTESVINALNLVIQIFDYYRSWDARLHDACSNENPFQALLDVAHEEFNCPMFFGQKTFRIYAITQQYPESQVYDGWDEVKRLMTMPIKVIELTTGPDMSLYPETLDVVAIPTNGDEHKRFDFQIRAMCRNSDGSVWGHLYIYYSGESVPQAILQLAKYVAGIYSFLIGKLSGKHKNQYSFLADLLDGEEISDDALKNLYSYNDWNENESLCLYAFFQRKIQKNRSLLDWIYSIIESRLIKEVFFLYKDSIIIISPERRHEPLMRGISSHVPLKGCQCGVSYPFRNIGDIGIAYYQALFASSFLGSENETFFYYKDCSFAGLTNYVRLNLTWKPFILPSLFDLYESDITHGTEYFKTLAYMINNNFHAGNTAKQLFIHRNTLTYRLDKTAQILGVDIFDPSVAAFLGFCISLMGIDYPIDIPEQSEHKETPPESK